MRWKLVHFYMSFEISWIRLRERQIRLVDVMATRYHAIFLHITAAVIVIWVHHRIAWQHANMNVTFQKVDVSRCYFGHDGLLSCITFSNGSSISMPSISVRSSNFALLRSSTVYPSSIDLLNYWNSRKISLEISCKTKKIIRLTTYIHVTIFINLNYDRICG